MCGDKKDKMLNVRVSHEVHDQLHKNADEAGISTSELVRRIISKTEKGGKIENEN